MAKAIPDGFRTVTPFLNIKDCDKAIAFYQKAFGAEVNHKHLGPDGKIMHCELTVGDSKLYLSEAIQMPPTQSSIWLFVNDADSWWKRAVAAGAQVRTPIADMFWGDRWGVVTDSFGNSWSIATHTEDVPPAELEERGKKFMSQMK